MTAPPAPSWPGRTLDPTPLVVAVLALAAGVSPLVGVSPLLLPLALLVGLVGVFLLQRPDLALRVAIVVVLLPGELIPDWLQSLLQVGAVCLAGAAAAAEAYRLRVGYRLPAATWLLGAFVVWSLLTTWWSDDPSLAPDLLRRYLLGLLLVAVIVVRTSDLRGVHRLMGSLAISAWIFVAAGLYSLAIGSQSPQGQLVVFGINPNDVGKTLLLVTPGVLWFAVVSRGDRRPLALPAVVFLLLSLLLVAESGSRGSLLAYGLLAVGFTATRLLRRWGLTAVALATLLVLATPSAFETVLDRFQNQESRQLSRVTLWSAGASLIGDRPFGVGLGVSPFVMPEYIDARTAVDHFKERDRYPVHNPFLEVGADTGLVGMALYGSVLVAAVGSFAGTQRRARRTLNLPWLAYGTVVGASAVAFLAVWVKSGGQSYNFSTFVLLGLLLAGSAPRLRRRSREAVLSPASASPPSEARSA